MTIALAGLEDSVFHYIDETIIHGKCLRQHNERLRKVLSRFRKYNLKLNLRKCHFLKPEIPFLGHKLTSEGILPCNKRFEVIDQYPVPTDAAAVLRFVSFANFYRKFIKDFSKIAYPLNKLLRKNAPWEWTEQQQVAFDTLRNALKNPPVLAYPKWDEIFILSTDRDLGQFCNRVLSAPDK